MNYNFLSFEEQKALQHWYYWLDDNRGDRARLRRAERPEDILLTDAFFHFLQQMPDEFPEKIFKNQRMLVGAAVAGLITHVKENTTSSCFAQQLATSSGEKKQKPPMSELRFQQLQKSRTTGDFYRRVLRAIRLLDGKVNIPSLANDIIHWHSEFNYQVDREPAKRLAVRWATDYFTALPKN